MFVNITPEQFKEVFNEVIVDYGQQMSSMWYENEILNEIMFGSNPKQGGKCGGVIEKIAQRLELESYKEYYKIDVILYKEKDLKHFESYETFAKYIPVAIEYENTAAKSFEEISKLSIYNIPLKVLITFPGDKEEYYLMEYTEILKDSDIFNDFSTKQRQLVIFGTREIQKINWRFHVYENGKFHLI